MRVIKSIAMHTALSSVISGCSDKKGAEASGTHEGNISATTSSGDVGNPGKVVAGTAHSAANHVIKGVGEQVQDVSGGSSSTGASPQNILPPMPRSSGQVISIRKHSTRKLPASTDPMPSVEGSMRPPLESGSGAGVASDPVQEAAAPASVPAAEAQQKVESPNEKEAALQANGVQLEANQPEANQPEANQPEANQPEAEKQQ
jgi:hypothetical protein